MKKRSMFVVVVLIVALVVCALALTACIDVGGTSSCGATVTADRATATFAAGQFHAELTALAAGVEYR